MEKKYLTREDIMKLGTGEIKITPEQRQKAKILGQRIKQNLSKEQKNTGEMENKMKKGCNSSESGGSVVSENIINGKGRLKWCVREESVNPADNGWRFFSDIDTSEFLSSVGNMQVIDWDSMVRIEPAVLAILDLPIGSDLVFIEDNGKKHFYDANSGKTVV